MNIAFIDTKYLIYWSLCGLFQQTGKNHTINCYADFDSFLQEMATFDPDLVIINPVLIQENMKVYLQTRKVSVAKWVGVLYSFYDREVITILDETIQITDTYKAIKEKIEKLIYSEPRIPGIKESKPLTARETDILKLITQGLSNKEIATKLNISVHTVVTHRRKIINKIGSRNPYDLLVYATANKIIENSLV